MADVIVVLGTKISYNGLPSKMLRNRVDKAIALHKKNKIPVLMTGKWSISSIRRPKTTEAQAMRTYALGQGLASKSIILEKDSRTTVENALFTKKILQKKKWTVLAIVTSEYHVQRAAYIFKKILGNKYTIHMVAASSGCSGLSLRKKHMLEKAKMPFVRRSLRKLGF